MKIAIAAVAIATGVVGATATPGARPAPTPIMSGRIPVPAALAMSNTALPTISGSAVQGSTLTASDGVWAGSPAPAFSYQWEDCDSGGGQCAPISGATSSSYVLGASDVGSTVEVLVTGTNSAGSSSAGSSPTAVIAGSSSAGSSPTAVIAGSSSAGSSPTAVVAGSSSAGSSPTAVIAGAPANTGVPAVSGSAVQGSTLTASDGVWAGSPAPAFSYQWEGCDSGGGQCSPISGATSSSYVLGASDVGSTVEVLVTGTSSAGSSSAASAATVVIAGAPANTAVPVVSGSAVQGGALTVSDGVWAGSPAPAFSYQWEGCDSGGGQCSPISGATSSSYVLGASDVGSTVEVLVTGTSSAGSSSAVSAATVVIAGAPANTAVPVVSGSAVQGGALTASDGVWAGSPAPAFTYQWEDCDSGGGQCSPISGATSSSYVLGASDVGSTVEVLVTGTSSAGSSSAGSSADGCDRGCSGEHGCAGGVWVGGAGGCVDGFGWGVGWIAGAGVQLSVGGL